MEKIECYVCKQRLDYNQFTKPILINKEKICKQCNYVIFLKKKITEIVVKQFEKDKLEIEKKKKEKKLTEKKYRYLERQKQYREQNVLKLKQKFVCNCGGVYTYTSKSNHFKTKRHIRYQNKNKS